MVTCDQCSNAALHARTDFMGRTVFFCNLHRPKGLHQGNWVHDGCVKLITEVETLKLQTSKPNRVCDQCGRPATHGEHWYSKVRYWCDTCVPMSGHYESCPDPCMKLTGMALMTTSMRCVKHADVYLVAVRHKDKQWTQCSKCILQVAPKPVVVSESNTMIPWADGMPMTADAVEAKLKDILAINNGNLQTMTDGEIVEAIEAGKWNAVVEAIKGKKKGVVEAQSVAPPDPLGAFEDRLDSIIRPKKVG